MNEYTVSHEAKLFSQTATVGIVAGERARSLELVGGMESVLHAHAFVAAGPLITATSCSPPSKTKLLLLP